MVRMGWEETHAYALSCSQLEDFTRLQLHGHGFMVQYTLLMDLMGESGMAARLGSLSKSRGRNEGERNLDAAIRDRECAESVLDVSFWDVRFEKLDEFVVTHQLHCTTKKEVSRVIREDAARLLLF